MKKINLIQTHWFGDEKAQSYKGAAPKHLLVLLFHSVPGAPYY